MFKAVRATWPIARPPVLSLSATNSRCMGRVWGALRQAQLSDTAVLGAWHRQSPAVRPEAKTDGMEVGY